MDIARTEEVTSNHIKGIATDNSTRIDALKRGQAPRNAANTPGKPVAPSFVSVDAVVLNLIFLSDPCVQHLDQFVVHVVRKIIGGKFIAHQSLTGNRKMQGEVPSIPSPLKRSVARRSHNLETHDEAQVDNGASLPEQLYFHTPLIDEVTKNDTQAFLEVEVEADQQKKPLLCKVDTGAEGNVISLISYKCHCQARHVILMVFLLTWHHPVLP